VNFDMRCAVGEKKPGSLGEPGFLIGWLRA
jgi:hypothetical protein